MIRNKRFTIKVYMMEAIETSEIYLSADIFLANERGNIMQTVVMTACRALNRVMPLPGKPVISSGTPN
jgi:hypothetical protein